MSAADGGWLLAESAEHGGLTRYLDGEFTNFAAEQGLPSDSPGYIREDRDGDLWIGTDKGLVRSRNNQTTVFTVKDGLPDNSISVIYPDQQGAIWLGTHEGWLSRFKEGEFTNYRLIAPDGAQNWVSAIRPAPDGGLWVGTNRGLFHFRDGVATKPSAHKELSDGVINCIVEDHAGALWVGTDARGAFRLSEGIVNQYHVEQGSKVRVI